MGSFAIDPANEGEPYIPHSQLLTLSNKGLLWLVEHAQYLSDISGESIYDRSKSDATAKVLVYLQAGWMIVQCITRLASQLMFTLLEVKTLGHVLCTLLIYFFRLRKPQDVQSPTKISGNWVQGFCAYMWRNSAMSRTDSGCPEINYLAWNPNAESGGEVEISVEKGEEPVATSTTTESLRHRKMKVQCQEEPNISIEAGKTLSATGIGFELSLYDMCQSPSLPGPNAPNNVKFSFQLDRVAIKGWRLVSNLIQGCPSILPPENRNTKEYFTRFL